MSQRRTAVHSRPVAPPAPPGLDLGRDPPNHDPRAVEIPRTKPPARPRARDRPGWRQERRRQWPGGNREGPGARASIRAAPGRRRNCHGVRAVAPGRVRFPPDRGHRFRAGRRPVPTPLAERLAQAWPRRSPSSERRPQPVALRPRARTADQRAGACQGFGPKEERLERSSRRRPPGSRNRIPREGRETAIAAGEMQAGPARRRVRGRNWRRKIPGLAGTSRRGMGNWLRSPARG